MYRGIAVVAPYLVPKDLPSALAVRARHLRLLAALLTSGGSAILVTELVSSGTFPLLGQVPKLSLVDVAHQLIAQQNFFTGANPYAILNYLRDDRRMAELVEEIELCPPWVWHISPQRCYLAYAITFRRRACVGPRVLTATGRDDLLQENEA